MSDANVLIVGAGPVGLSVALELARRGYEPRIIDKGTGFTPENESRALGVNNRTLQLLSPSGATERMLDDGLKVTEACIINEQKRRVVGFDFAARGVLYPFMLILPQGRTERILASALKSHGISVERQTELISVESDSANPVVTLKNPQGDEIVRADILIGTDGSNSTVRQQYNFAFDGEGYPVEFGLADIILSDPTPEHQVSIRFTQDGFVALIPVKPGVLRAVSPRPDVIAGLPDDIAVKEVIWRSTFHVSFRHVSSMQKGAVFLAGDAAHVHSPVGARGMNLGIEDACWLAWLIDETRAAEYSRLRLPAAHKVVEQTKQQTNGLVNMNIAGRFLRDHIADHLLKFGPFKSAAIKRLLGLDTPNPPWLSN